MPNALKRVLIEEEIKKIIPYTTTLTNNMENRWKAYQNIYNYMKTNIKSTYDLPFPYLMITQVKLKDINYITNVTLRYVPNYIQTPETTLKYGQGDCEDQAIAAYAIIKYYHKNILKEEHKTYLAHIQYQSGRAHLTTIIYEPEGKICIIDPPTNYITNINNQITAKPVYQELITYSNLWKSQEGRITYIKVYDVNIINGNHQIAAKGTIEEISMILQEN